MLSIPVFAQSASDPCPRPRPGSIITEPADLRSSGGALKVAFDFRGFIDIYGLQLYCYVYNGHEESPTLRVYPGDELVISLRNDLTAAPHPPGHDHGMELRGPCRGGKLSAASTNLHFHGLHISPGCHQDDVLSTLVQPSSIEYEYRFRIPKNQPPGLYWYHPHPHGFGEQQVLGGASGALIVEGIERAKPEVAGLPERVLALRDQIIPGPEGAEDSEDAGMDKDASVNFVPVMYPLYRPAEMKVKPGEREFWRVLNAAADTYFDVEVRFGPSIQDVQQPQPLLLIALDGVPVGDRDPARTHILIPPGSRAEFVVTMPPANQVAQLVSLSHDMGPEGEPTLYRALVNIRPSADAPAAQSSIPANSGKPGAAPKFAGLAALKPVRERTLYFSEKRPDPDDRAKDVYFITPEGRIPKAFDMNSTQPDVTVRHGTVEDWIIENRTAESHVFHIHQLHFQVLERDGGKVEEPELRDTIDVPFWDGKSARYPSVKLRMDFLSPEIVGTFLYHCHILEHGDRGMMGTIRVE
jgi:FtsP/CotA-like multicopper oxidase with cupredoxin domain